MTALASRAISRSPEPPAAGGAAQDGGERVRRVGRVVRWTPFGADVAFHGQRPVWVPRGLAEVREVELGRDIGFLLPRAFLAERGLL